MDLSRHLLANSSTTTMRQTDGCWKMVVKCQQSTRMWRAKIKLIRLQIRLLLWSTHSLITHLSLDFAPSGHKGRALAIFGFHVGSTLLVSKQVLALPPQHGPMSLVKSVVASICWRSTKNWLKRRALNSLLHPTVVLE